MANYYTHFSTYLGVGKENEAKALEIFEDLKEKMEESDDECLMFEAEGEGDGNIWIWDGGEMGFPEHVVMYVLELAEKLKLKGAWGFEWAGTCSRPRIDAYGGGAVCIDLEDGVVEWMSSGHWLHEQLHGAQDA